jgi:pilus assembly protein CpaE
MPLHHPSPLLLQMFRNRGTAAQAEPAALREGQPMRVMLVGDNDQLVAQIRQSLTGMALLAADVKVHGLDEAVDRLVQLRPAVVVLVLSPAPERALATLREIRTMLPTHVLAIGPAADPRLILQTLRDGACQYIDEQDPPDEIAAILKRLSVETPQRAVQGRLITVLTPSGGNGGSTIASNIATVLARRYQHCGLFDLKLETGDLATLLNIKPEHSIADFCLNMERMDQVMFEQCFTEHSSGVRLMAPPRHHSQIEQVTPRGVRKALSMARSLYPFVVVDLDHSFRGIHAQALHQAEVVLLVMQLDFTSLHQARRALDYLEEIGIPANLIQLVVNRHRRARELPVSQVEEMLGIKVRHFIPDDFKNVVAANNKGVPVVLEKPRAKSSRSITNIAVSLNGQLR